MYICRPVKRFGIIFLALVTLLVAGCGGKVKDVSVTSFRIVSVRLQGVSGMTALAKVGIHNPAVGFEVTGMRAVIRMRGEDALVLTADQLMVEGRSDRLYDVPFKGSIAEGFNPFHLLKLLSDEVDMSQMTVDVTAKVSIRGRFGKNVEYKDIPLETLMGDF